MKMRFRVAWVALGFFVVACSDRGVKRELEDWRATPEVLTFDGAIVGVRVRAELTLNNLSRAPVSVSLAVSEPFTVEAETIELAGGQERVLWVSLVATAPGPLKGTLQVRSLDTEQTIALVADVQPPSPCLPRGPCEQVVIEPSTQACIRSVQADGTSCATACLENGVCSAGECKGTAKNCDDGNACTLDACDVLSGCTHDGAVNCPKSTNPCQVPFCDSKTGCGQTDAADGTRCGAADCTTANVCIQGVCKTLPVPEGSKCGEESPCQPLGTCRAQVCERVAPTEILPSWTYSAPAAGAILNSYSGVSGTDGALYWLETDATTSWFVSVTQDGLLRYRQPVGRRVLWPHGEFLSGLRYVFFSADGWVEARDTRDGSLWWRRQVADYLSPADMTRIAGTTQLKWTAADSGLGFAYAGLNAREPQTAIAVGEFLLAIDLRTGQSIWKETRSPFDPLRLDFMLSDENGNAFFQESANQRPDVRFVSFDRNGTERWVQNVSESWLQGTYGGRLFSTSVVFDTATGAQQIFDTHAYGQVITENVAFRSVYSPTGGIERRNLETGLAEWTVPGGADELILLQNQHVLGLAGQDLTELTPEGKVQYQCRLNTTTRGRASLHAGHLVIFNSAAHQISSYSILDRDLAPKGWVVQSGGKNMRGSRPR